MPASHDPLTAKPDANGEARRPSGGRHAAGSRRLTLATTIEVSIWLVAERFFTAKGAFRELYERYETRVLRYSEERGVDRRFLRLNAKEVSELLDFRSLERLRDRQLDELKATSHELFRRVNTTDKFDRYVSEIYHEASILKEEHYRVSRFAEEYDQSTEEEIYHDALDEVHEQFPRKVHGIHDLFDRAQRRLEAILPEHVDDKVLIRSFYLFGDEILAQIYPGRLEDLYRILYPGGTIQGYYAAGISFLEGGFREHATACMEKAENSAEQEREIGDLSDEATKALQEASAALAKLRAEQAEKRRSPSGSQRLPAASRRLKIQPVSPPGTSPAPPKEDESRHVS